MRLTAKVRRRPNDRTHSYLFLLQHVPDRPPNPVARLLQLFDHVGRQEAGRTRHQNRELRHDRLRPVTDTDTVSHGDIITNKQNNREF